MKLKATRNTKFFKTVVDDIIYTDRQLSISEINMLDNMSNPYNKNNVACMLSLVEGYFEDIPWQKRQQIGTKVLEFSTEIIRNQEYLEAIAKKHQLRLANDEIIEMIKVILDIIPNTNIEYLLSLTVEDIIELVCICEKIANKRIFTFKGSNNTMKVGDKKPTQDMPSSLPDGTTIGDDGKLYFEDEGKSLKDKMKETNKFYK